MNMEGCKRFPGFPLTLLVLLPILLVAQAPDTLWTRTYGGPEVQSGYSVQQTSDGGYIAVGYFEPSGGYNRTQLYVVKTDSVGDTLWTRTHGHYGFDVGYSVRETFDGGYIIVGTNIYWDGIIGWPLIYVIKLDATGDIYWEKEYFERLGVHGMSIRECDDSGYILAGRKDFLALLMKLDLFGDTLWARTYHADGLRAVKTCSDGGFVAAGDFPDSIAGMQFFILRTDFLGDVLWMKSYGGVDIERAYDIITTADGGYAVTGYTWSFGAGHEDVYVLRLDCNGDTLWTRTYGGPNSDMGFSIQQSVDGGFVIVGETQSFGAEGKNLYLIKTDTMGNIVAQRTYGGAGHDGGHAIEPTVDGGYIVTGYTGSFGVSIYDIWLLKFAPDVGVDEDQNISIRYNYYNTTIFSGPLQLPEGRQCKVFDITGRVVMRDKIKPGIYFVEIDGKIAQKVIKVR